MNLNNVTFIPRRCIQIVKPHKPLIKFRNGSGIDHRNSGTSNKGGSFNPIITRSILEDYQLPLKYRRQPMDEREINAINSGGVY